MTRLAAADVAPGRDPLSDVLRQSRQRTDVVAVAVHVASEIVATLHVRAVVILVSAPWWPYSSLVVATRVGTLSSWSCVSRSCTSILLCCLRWLRPSTARAWLSGPCMSRSGRLCERGRKRRGQERHGRVWSH